MRGKEQSRGAEGNDSTSFSGLWTGRPEDEASGLGDGVLLVGKNRDHGDAGAGGKAMARRLARGLQGLGLQAMRSAWPALEALERPASAGGDMQGRGSRGKRPRPDVLRGSAGLFWRWRPGARRAEEQGRWL